MSSYAALLHTTWLAGLDFTSQTTQVELPISWEEQDATVFGNLAHQRKATLQDVEATVTGFWEAGDDGVDTHAVANLGGLQVATHSNDGETGSPAYFFQARSFTYQIGDEIGSLLPFELGLRGARGNGNRAAGVVRGKVAAGIGTVSAEGAVGDALELGAGDGKHLYMAVHVFSAGTTISLQVQSDDAEAFTDPTDVASATLGPITAAGGYWMARVDVDSVTDTWWRVVVPTDGITGSFSMAAAIGLQ